jgi:hypothetical protein
MGWQHDAEAAPCAVNIVEGLVQFLEQQRAAGIADADRHILVAREKVGQHVLHAGRGAIGTRLLQKMGDRDLLLLQAFLLALGQGQPAAPVNGHADQAQAQHGLQGQRARQPAAQVRDLRSAWRDVISGHEWLLCWKIHCLRFAGKGTDHESW